MGQLRTKVVDLLPDGTRKVLRKGRASLRRTVRRSKALFKRSTPDAPSGLLFDTVEGYEFAYRADSEDRQVLDHSLPQYIKFLDEIDFRLTKDAVVLDVGAHIGTFALWTAGKASKGRVYALEASEDSFNLLRINVALNGLKHILPMHLALYDSKSTCTLSHTYWNTGHSVTTARKGPGDESVACDTLQNLLDKHNIDRCDLAKFNCEGAEFRILLNSPCETLRKIQTMIILYHADLSAGDNPAALEDYLHSCGFSTQVYKRVTHRGWMLARLQA